VLQIRDILVRVRIRTSGLTDPDSDSNPTPDPDPDPAILSVTFKMATKNCFFFCFLLFDATVASFFKDKKP
jgi:hypothetical protein